MNKNKKRLPIKIGVGFGENSKGSSTLALLLASAFYSKGEKVVLIDADVTGYSLSKWRANESDLRLNNEIYRTFFQQEIKENKPELVLQKISEAEMDTISLDQYCEDYDYQIYDLPNQPEMVSFNLLRQLDLVVTPVYARYHSFFQIENLRKQLSQLQKQEEGSGNPIPQGVAVNYFFNGTMPVFLAKYLHTFSFVNDLKMFGGFFPYDRTLDCILGKKVPVKKEDCALSTFYGYTSFLSQKTIIPTQSLCDYLLQTHEQRERLESRPKYIKAGSNFEDLYLSDESEESKLVSIPKSMYSKLECINKRYGNIGVSNIAVALLETGINELDENTRPIIPSNAVPEKEESPAKEEELKVEEPKPHDEYTNDQQTSGENSTSSQEIRPTV